MTYDEIAEYSRRDPRTVADYSIVPLLEVEAAYQREQDPAQRERLRILSLRVETAQPPVRLPVDSSPLEQPRPEGMRCQLFGSTQCANCDAAIPDGCTTHCMDCTKWYNCPCARGNYHARQRSY